MTTTQQQQKGNLFSAFYQLIQTQMNGMGKEPLVSCLVKKDSREKDGKFHVKKRVHFAVSMELQLSKNERVLKISWTFTKSGLCNCVSFEWKNILLDIFLDCGRRSVLFTVPFWAVLLLDVIIVVD